MPFRFLKYIQPTNYFSLPVDQHHTVFPIVETINKSIKPYLNADEKFNSETAKAYDLSWQAVQLGYIGNAKTYTSFEQLPLEDEYQFIKKYYNPIWVLYILILRLISFKNPITNISAFLKCRTTKRSNYLNHPIAYNRWDDFKSQLLEDRPLVSIIIPTLNRYKYLKDVLNDLEQQDYKNIEVIVVDQSSPFNEAFYVQFNLKITVKYQEERALWLARNTAIKLSKGELLLFFDDDSRVEPNWVTNHLKCLDFFDADISSGVSISVVGDKVPKHYSFFRRADQLDTGNVLLKKTIFREIGLFDRQFEKQRMGDGEFGLRTHINGFLNISNPFAKRLHLKVGSGGLREMGSWDSFRTKKWLDPRPIPSVLYLYRKYYGNYKSMLKLLKTVPASTMPYRFKGNKLLLIVGALTSLFIFPFIVIQVVKSWKLASKKLKEGSFIESLN